MRGAWATVVLLGVLGCATTTPHESPKRALEETAPSEVTDAYQPIAPAPDKGAIRTECTPADAVVVVDGTTRGLASDFSGRAFLELDPGPHRIELRKEGYATYRAEVYVAAEVTETIPVTLRRLPAAAADAAPDGAAKESTE